MAIFIVFPSFFSLEKIQNSFQLEINGNYHESQIMDQLCSNPIHVYQLIKATKSLDWKEVQEVDVLGATNAVVNTQFTYKLPTEDLIVGQIGQRQTHGFLDAPDCLILAKSRISNDYASQYALAIEWAEMALSLDTSSQEIQDFLDEMKDLHDIKFIPSAYEDGQFFIRIFNGTDITTKQLRILEENQFQRKFPSEDWEELRQRNQLCRGEKISNFVGYCEYRTNNDPWLLLSPLKAEILYEKFPLVLFHGLISNTEILILKDLAQKDMKRSSVHSASGNEATFQRIQSSAWLWDPDHDLLQTLSKRLDHALQLSVSQCSEPYQIGVYPPGGYYTHHYDVLEPISSEDVWTGNRIATLMFYVMHQFDDF